jgi:hydroxyethylthiazole kinase-like uncharacterized protein yjeF
MQRDPNSRKGQNGSVTVIGGSKQMHGAPIFAALAAEATGVDLIHPCVPEIHAEVTKNASNNFIVTPFRGDDLSKTDVSAIEEVIAGSTVAVIGPGLADYDTTQKAAEKLIRDSNIPMVIDATALQPWTFSAAEGKTAVLTPHVGELARMQGQVLHQKDHPEHKDIVCTIADERNVTMVLKGPIDIIAGAEGSCAEIKGGNAGLTVGGTGDALAGLIAGLMAQGVKPVDACTMGTTIIKRAATALYNDKGYGFTTMDVISQIPHLVHTYE